LNVFPFTQMPESLMWSEIAYMFRRLASVHSRYRHMTTDSMGARRHGQGGHMPSPLENSKCIQKYVNVTVIGCYML